MRHLITLSSIFLTCGLNAQSPASNHAWLTTDNISVRITPTGIHADSSGGFLLNQPGGNTVNLLSHLTPWIVGEDPAGNLKAACELEDPDFSDWKPGFRGIPNSGKVWKLTNDQIAIHLADFADNGVIDNPIPEIFAWPARGNQYSLDFNGFAVPFEPPGLRLLAEFYDKNDNGMYDPQEGEYPVFAYPGTYRLAGDQIAYAPFYSDALAILTNGKTVQTEARLLAATFACNQQEFLENTVFMDYRFFYSDIEKVHSSVFSLFTDFDIGNPNDDYLGSTLPFSWSVYAYNSDTLFDVKTGANPPMLSLNVFNSPVDTNGIYHGIYKFMPVHPGTQEYFADSPSYLSDFISYSSGYWRDGTPLTYGGLGHLGSSVTDWAYTSHPADPLGWSELSANNTLEDRSALVSFDAVELRPGEVKSILFSLTASKEAGISAQLNQMKEFKSLQDYLIYWYSFDSSFQMLCDPLETAEPSGNRMVIFPNPASDYFNIRSTGSPIKDIALYDMLGRWIGNYKASLDMANTIRVEVAGMSPGVYMVSWRLQDGKQGLGKVVVGR